MPTVLGLLRDDTVISNVETSQGIFYANFTLYNFFHIMANISQLNFLTLVQNSTSLSLLDSNWTDYQMATTNPFDVKWKQEIFFHLMNL